MALKSKLSKTEFDALPDALKEHYKEANGSYVLDTDDAAELREAAKRAREERDAAATKAAEATAEAARLKAAADEAAAEAARKANDLPTLEASWKKKGDDAVAAEKATNATLQRKIETLLVDNVAQSIAAEISSAPDLLIPHIKARLKAEYEGDASTTRVLDDNGAISAKTIEEFKAEVIANPKYAAIIVASKANGGAGSHASASGGAGKNFKEMNEAERVALYQRVGETEYNRIAAAS